MIALCSPNMDFIPRIVQGDVSLTLMSDGRFGILDPILWPQIHSDQYAYLAAVRKTVPCHHRAAAMWLDPTPDDFQELTGTPVRGLGFFAPTYVAHLDQLVQSILGEVRLLQFSTPGTSHGHASVAWHELCMRQALSRLQVIPATFRDQSIQVRVLQRHWIMTEAFLEFNRLLQDDERACAPLPLQADMMGAWTTNPQVVHQYIRLGLPVWFLRRELHAPVASESPIPSSLEPVSPSHICSEPLVPGCVLYHGLAGDGHLRQTIRRAHPYLDISPNVTVSNPVASSAIPPAPLPTRQVRKEYAARAALLGLRSQPAESAPFSPNPSARGSPRTRARRSGAGATGRDKFGRYAHPWMPDPIPSWEHALEKARAIPPWPDCTFPWGYWVPEPAMLVGPREQDRQSRYLLNWLRARPVWLTKLNQPQSRPSAVPTQHWRSFLNGMPDDLSVATKTGKRYFELKQLFDGLCEDSALDPDATGPVQWHGHQISEISPQTACWVLWECHELAFRYELQALDRLLRPAERDDDEALRHERLAPVFPRRSLHAVAELPGNYAFGLFARLPHRRVNSLNALREVLSPWPMSPPELRAMEPLQLRDSEDYILEREACLASFYVSTFVKYAGRPPIVPHYIPLQPCNLD
ncbi:hypothetical protein C8Q76DRAFT_629713 [Earliella scabrosa]|nr:hypothetical protein C8Q76DRAFT_629713 [Earliella scabrosa]